MVVIHHQDGATGQDAVLPLLGNAPRLFRRLYRSFGNRNGDGEDRSLTDLGTDLDLMAEQAGRAGDGAEAKADPPVPVARRIVRLQEILKNRFGLVVRNAGAGVGDMDIDRSFTAHGIQQYAATSRKFYGIGKQVAQNLLQQHGSLDTATFAGLTSNISRAAVVWPSNSAARRVSNSSRSKA